MDVNTDMDLPNFELVYSCDATEKIVYTDRPVALCSVEELIVVVANDCAMICRKGMNQPVKNAADENIVGK